MKVPLPKLSVSLSNVLYVPDAQPIIFSLIAFTRDNNIMVEFVNDCFFMKDKATKQVLYQGQSKDDIYPLHVYGSP